MEPASPLDGDAVPLNESFSAHRKPLQGSPKDLRGARSLARCGRAIVRRVGPALPHVAAFSIGASFAAQSGMSAALTDRILGDSVLATVCNFVVGSIYLLLLNAADCSYGLYRHRFVGPQCPRWWWLFPGGLLGALALGTRIFCTSKIGFTLTSITAVTGQLLTSVVVDQFGLMGMPRRALTAWRAAGVVCVLAGCILSTLGPSPLQGNSESIAFLALYSFLSLLGAAGLPLQTTVNRKLATVLHGFLRSAMISFPVSLVTLVLFVCFRSLVDSEAAPLSDLHRLGELPLGWWWMLLPGVVGATYNFSAPKLAGPLGMSLFFVLLTAGQFIASLGFDTMGAFFQPARPMTMFRIAGVVLVFVAAIMVNSARSKKDPSPTPATTADSVVMFAEVEAEVEDENVVDLQ